MNSLFPARSAGALPALTALVAALGSAVPGSAVPGSVGPGVRGPGRPECVEWGLAPHFSEHMVLQRQRSVPIWGRGRPGETVRVSVAGVAAEARVDELGAWRATLPELEAGGPHELVVSSEGLPDLVVGDVLVGEVWLCSGQSNMGMRVKHVLDAPAEIAASSHPRLRVFMVAKTCALEPAPEVHGNWAVCGPDTVERLSATAYFFGRSLQERLDVPVGLLVSAVGGSGACAWTPVAAQEAAPELASFLRSVWIDLRERQRIYEREYLPNAELYDRHAREQWERQAKAARAAGREPPPPPRPMTDPRQDRNYPGTLYNGMLAPLVGTALRGVIWYQGEYDTGTSLETIRKAHPQLYGAQLRTLIASLRSAWGEDLPFYQVQLASWLAPASEPVEDDGWAIVREQQRLVAASVPGVGLAVAIDVGDAVNIHPPDKQAVGERLARLALARTYGVELEDSGPLFQGIEVRGAELRVRFSHAGGMTTRDGLAPTGFAIAGADRRWYAARARIEGSDVLLSSPEVTAPVAVRYAWAANPPVNLVNAAGLPAVPFRSDDWPIELRPGRTVGKGATQED